MKSALIIFVFGFIFPRILYRLVYKAVFGLDVLNNVAEYQNIYDFAYGVLILILSFQIANKLKINYPLLMLLPFCLSIPVLFTYAVVLLFPDQKVLADAIGSITMAVAIAYSLIKISHHAYHRSH